MYYPSSFKMSQEIDCCEVWPTNMLMLEAAKTMAPQHSEKLQELLLLTEKGMSCKAEMDTYIAAWFNSYNLECSPFSEWPSNLNNFLCCWGSSPEEKKLALNRLWELAGEGYRAKQKMDGMILRILDSRYQSTAGKIELDAVIVKILDGTFEGDLFDATPVIPASSSAETVSTLPSDIDDYLPLGGHLLPDEYRKFLYGWNKTIEDANGAWLGAPRQRYKAEHPEEWSEWLAENKRLKALYAAAVAAAKAYQAAHPEERDELEAAPPPKVPRCLYYNHHNWPSPRAKTFVQALRKRHIYRNSSAWSDTFKKLWQAAGNTEYKLTHDNCLRYLARSCKTTVEQFLERTPVEVNTQLFSEYHGVPGFFTKRYGYF